MSRSTYWSLLAFSMAFISYAMHRDISANIFLATVFIIQGLKDRQEISQQHQDNISRAILILSVGICAFATWSLISGIDLGKPGSFVSRQK